VQLYDTKGKADYNQHGCKTTGFLTLALNGTHRWAFFFGRLKLRNSIRQHGRGGFM